MASPACSSFKQKEALWLFKWLIASPWILVSLVGNFVFEELSSRDFFFYIPSFSLPTKGVPACSDLFLPLHKNLSSLPPLCVFVFLHQWGSVVPLACQILFLPLFWPNPRGGNPNMPKIYAKHNLIPCGFISAKKPVGGSRGQSPPRMCPTWSEDSSEPAAPGGAFMLELPRDPAEGLTAS